MKKLLIIAGIAIALAVAYWLISPLFITREVSERVEDIPAGTQTETGGESAVQTISAGTFAGVAGHSAGGTAKLLKTGNSYYLRFEDDFKVTNGPDLFVYFGRDGKYANTAQVAALKGNVGSQNYAVPPGINPADFNEIWVWCRAFSVPFGVAALK